MKPATILPMNSPLHLFITGTDTGVGKTHVTSLWLHQLNATGNRAVGYKPVCSGGREDALALTRASAPGAALDEINPVWFQSPLSPLVASRIERRPVSLASLAAGYQHLASKFDSVLVEGAGGWETPLTDGKTMADLAAALALPVVVVVNNRLGAINHTILTVQAIQSRDLFCRGIILNYPEDERDPASISNRSVLEEFLDVPILADSLHGADTLEWEAPWH